MVIRCSLALFRAFVLEFNANMIPLNCLYSCIMDHSTNAIAITEHFGIESPP